jgi:hypothetical protein
MKKNINFLSAVFFAILFLGSWIVSPGSEAYAARDIVVAQADGTDAPRGRRHHGPPPEAISACDGLSDGDTCSFTSRRGDEIEGTCGTTRGGDFACMPEGGPPGKGRRGPQDMPPPPSDDSY